IAIPLYRNDAIPSLCYANSNSENDIPTVAQLSNFMTSRARSLSMTLYFVVMIVRHPGLQLAIGTAMADILLGWHSPYRRHWYERTYPLSLPPGHLARLVCGMGPNTCANGSTQPAACSHLADQINNLLTPRLGQVATRPATLSAALWCLSLVRRWAQPPPPSLVSPSLLIGLLDEKDGT
ncbi:unnamed protein product, partial [Protopolystoma xenopodis]